jgi:hypothetical protein
VTYRSRMGKGEETHPAEEFVVVCEYALNQPKSKHLAGVLELLLHPMLYLCATC